MYIAGDTHGNFKKIAHLAITNKPRTVCVLGDCGIVWSPRESNEERMVLDFLARNNITLLFIDGNHENFIRLLKLEEVDIGLGAPVGQVSDNCYHLKRGYVYTIEGKKYFTFGGAMSVDKHLRLDGVSWFKEELATHAETDRGIDSLEKVGNEVDYILTHTCPHPVLLKLTAWLPSGLSAKPIVDDPTCRYLSHIEYLTKFSMWFFGHFHIDRNFTWNGKNYVCVYDRVFPNPPEYDNG